MLKFDTLTAADYAARKLDSLLERASRDMAEVIQNGTIEEAAKHFAQLRDTVKILNEKMVAVQRHLDGISQEYIPTLYLNAGVTSVNIKGLGRVTVNDRWNASVVDTDKAFTYVRDHGQGGMIKETIHPQTLGAWAREEAMSQRPLPTDVFKVTTVPYTSITKT